MSDSKSDRWISAQLRQVPLPEGLLERLRAVAQQSDGKLDALLSDVPVPAGLVGRLREIVGAEAMDTRLRDVPIPARLLANLRGVPEDETLDESLRRVPGPLPVRTFRKLAAIPDRTRRWQHFWHLATAASLLLTISISYFLTMFGLMADAYSPPSGEVLVVRLPDSQIDLLALAAVEFELVVPAPEPARALADTPEPAIELMALREVDRPTLRETTLGPFGTYDLLADSKLISWKPLGSLHRGDDDLPGLQSVARPRPGGLAPPLDRGYDRAFLHRHGEHPVVTLAEGSGLATREVPLTAATDSFDQAERAVAQQTLPRAGDLRAEDFLAAMDYQFPLPPPGELGIRTAAGPSVFGEAGAKLLQVGVQAGPSAHGSAGATHITLAVDVSASMGWEGRLDATRGALRSLVGHLAPDDRLSLVRFQEQPYVDKEYKGPDDAGELFAAIDWLQPGGGTDLGAGLQLAASVALRHPSVEGVTPRLVLVSDGVSGLPERTVVAMEQFLARVSGQGIELSVIDVSGGERENPLLGRLARAAGGGILKARTAEEIRWTLVKTLTGGPSLAASDAVLRVTFNPGVVAGYRLIGHAPAVAGLMPQGAEAPLRCRQAATALFEVWLKPNGGGEVATARVDWRDPATGGTHHLQQRISRLQFAPSLAEAPLSLQAATIAAETAEMLGDSYFALGHTNGLQDVLALAGDVNPRLRSRDAFRRFVAFVESAERTRTWRGSEPR